MNGSDVVVAVEDRLAAVDAVLDARGIDRVRAAVVGLVVMGLLARLFALGGRVAHFDEARVGYWILHFMETGEFHYRFAIHGPFVQHVNTAVFSALGVNDVTLRLVVALIGALLPLSVLLLREHLRDGEVVVAAAFLAANPIVLYYSRFFRSTIPVATFCFLAFALLVRYYDTRRLRYFHAGILALALAFTAKENAVVYVLVWLGAGALILDHELFRPRASETGFQRIGAVWTRTVRDRNLRDVLPRAVGHLLLSGAIFAAVILFFYAPRAGSPGGVGLYNALGNPGLFPEVVSATIDDIVEGYAWWFGDAGRTGSGQPLAEQYVEFFRQMVTVLAGYAGPLVALAVVGTLIERFASDSPRNLVMFSAYWGFVSVLGYPLGTDIFGAWIAVNAVVPLAIPAAVGAGVLYRWAKAARADEDWVSVGIVGFLSLLVVGQVLLTGAGSVYANPASAENDLVQFGQPGDDIRPTMRDVGTLAAGNDGTDVLFFGPALSNTRDEAMEPDCANVRETLPLQWYLTREDASADCTVTEFRLRQQLSASPPPVVITLERNASTVAAELPDYERRLLLIHTSGERMAFFLDTDRLGGARE
jgi:uncharacterized protein (TIGR03663 family)